MFKDNILWGLGRGLFVGAVLGTFAGIVLAVKGVPSGTDVDLVALLVLYPMSGALGGLIVGACRPLLTRPVGAIMVVTVAILPFSALFLHIAEKPIGQWDMVEWGLCVLASGILAIIGVAVFRQP